MRLIATLLDQKESVLLSNYLTSQNIENTLEATTGKDWGNENYGVTTYTIWIIEENDLDKALGIAKKFFIETDKKPFEEAVSTHLKNSPPKPHQSPSFFDQSEEPNEQNAPPPSEVEAMEAQEPFGRVTLYILMLCCLLFFMARESAPEPNVVSKLTEEALPIAPLYQSPLKKKLFYDYPHAYEIVDEIIAAISAEESPSNKKIETIASLKAEYEHSPFWPGLYDKLVKYFQKGEANLSNNAPLFEKIREGEFWRLLTPIFLHADLFHLLFNMILFIVLGRQIEERMGALRYLLFILITGIATNTVQYLMTGYSFLGISGVLCAMLTFIWIRQRKSPWEGYQLSPQTFNFACVFLFLIFALQLISFYAEIAHKLPSPLYVANSAHMTGLLTGVLLGNLNFFSWQHPN